MCVCMSVYVRVSRYAKACVQMSSTARKRHQIKFEARVIEVCKPHDTGNRWDQNLFIKCSALLNHLSMPICLFFEAELHVVQASLTFAMYLRIMLTFCVTF